MKSGKQALKRQIFSSLCSRPSAAVCVRVPPKHRREGSLARGRFQTEMLTSQQSTAQHPRIAAEGTWNHKFWMVPNSLLPAPGKSNSPFHSQRTCQVLQFQQQSHCFHPRTRLADRAEVSLIKASVVVNSDLQTVHLLNNRKLGVCRKTW